MLVSGLIEYGTSVYLELVHNMSWWNYDGYFLNINGRVCLEGLLVFAIGGIIVTYMLAPLIANFLKRINKKIKIVNCYEVTEFNTNIKEILDEHDKILNTSGEKEKGEVFEGYSDVKINEAK